MTIFRRLNRPASSFAAILTLTFLLTGCALNEQVRTAGPFPDDNSDAKEKALEYRSIERYQIQNEIQEEDRSPKISAAAADDHSIIFRHETAYIEFDEQGDFFDREQLRVALNEMPTKGNHIVLIYVHGWQNNSESEDAAKFNTFIAHLNRALAFRTRKTPGASPWSVYGVYLSWRGTLLPPSYRYLPHNENTPEPASAAFADQENPVEKLTPFKYVVRDFPKLMSFWSREADAGKVAGAPMEEAINSLAAKARDTSASSRVMVIGHSFGALVVEKTILQDYSTLFCFPHHGVIQPPVDFVVLLNSAAPSIYAKEFIDALKWRNVGQADTPFVVSVTSESDLATKEAFPAGTLVGSAFDIGSYQDSNSNNYRGAPQKRFFTTTPGHSDYLASYDAVPENDVSLKFNTEGRTDEWLLSRNLNLDKSQYPDLPVIPNSTEFLAWGDNGYGKIEGDDGHAHPQLWHLTPTRPESDEGSAPIYNKTAYWIIRVPKQIIASHTDIWCPNSVNLIAALFRMSGQLAGKGKPEIPVGAPPDSAKRPDKLVRLQPYPAENPLLK
jgi:pimeloyl-ACP methyl ester carboxylesterase